MDFDLDDPLGSDDSFFEEPKALGKRQSITKSPEKKTLESLLGFATNSAENIYKSEIKDPILKPKSTITFQDMKTESIVRKPIESWQSEVPKKEKLKKTDFLEDILSDKSKTKTEKQVTSLEDILKESKANTGHKSSMKDNNATQSQSDLSFTALPERRKGRRGSGIEDNLGLGLFNDEYQFGDFYSKDKKEAIQKSVEPAPKSTPEGVPDWLGTGPSNMKRAESPYVQKLEKVPTEVTSQKEEIRQEQLQKENLVSDSPSKKLITAITDWPSKLSPQNINMEIQNSYSSLHQQESLLLISLQFKKYEEVLKEIQNKQQEILGKQEKNFKNFADEYIIKQQLTENNIRLQQERINQHIQLLLSDPLNKSAHSLEDNEEDRNTSKEMSYESLVQKIKMRHDEELFLMEESYKKQIELIEKSVAGIEGKLQNEIKNLTEIFEAKTNNLKIYFEEETDYYKQKLKSMGEEHLNEIKLLKENHYQKIEDIKSEHTIQIAYIKEMKQKEKSLLYEGQELSQKLNRGIETLDYNVKVIQDMEEKVNKNYDVFAIAREQNLQSKEKEIILMRNALEKCRESAENERAQLFSLIRNLELKLAEQSTNAQEDRWALQQATATLIARSKAVEREAEYSKNIIEREREQLKTLKESLLSEQEKIVMQLTEEKLLLVSEKAKFETSSKLTNTFEVERVKAEAESAIEEAKHLSEKLNQERTNMQRQKNELHALKNNLAERERELEDKEAELDFLLQDAHRKLKEDKEVLMEAKRMENMYKDRMKELKNQWVQLSKREKKIAEEKVLLSKERLAVYTATKASKDCALCNATGEPQFGEHLPAVSHENFNSKIFDAAALKIRLESMDDEESEVSKEGSNSHR